MLLRAIGVRRDDILADYLRTEPNLPRLWAALRAAGVPEPHNRALLGVQAGAPWRAVLDEIETADGGVGRLGDRVRHRSGPSRAAAPATCSARLARRLTQLG